MTYITIPNFEKKNKALNFGLGKFNFDSIRSPLSCWLLGEQGPFEPRGHGGLEGAFLKKFSWFRRSLLTKQPTQQWRSYQVKIEFAQTKVESFILLLKAFRRIQLGC